MAEGEARKTFRHVGVSLRPLGTYICSQIPDQVWLYLSPLSASISGYYHFILVKGLFPFQNCWKVLYVTSKQYV